MKCLFDPITFLFVCECKHESLVCETVVQMSSVSSTASDLNVMNVYLFIFSPRIRSKDPMEEFA